MAFRERNKKQSFQVEALIMPVSLTWNHADIWRAMHGPSVLFSTKRITPKGDISQVARQWIATSSIPSSILGVAVGNVLRHFVQL